MVKVVMMKMVMCHKQDGENARYNLQMLRNIHRSYSTSSDYAMIRGEAWLKDSGSRPGPFITQDTSCSLRGELVQLRNATRSPMTTGTANGNIWLRSAGRDGCGPVSLTFAFLAGFLHNVRRTAFSA